MLRSRYHVPLRSSMIIPRWFEDIHCYYESVIFQNLVIVQGITMMTFVIQRQVYSSICERKVTLLSSKIQCAQLIHLCLYAYLIKCSFVVSSVIIVERSLMP
ncbi:hypothetical protein BDV12DRAFT_70505 [Aspergillus spectabilis]